MERTETSVATRLLKVLAVLEDALLIVLLAAMVGIAGLQIVLRNLFNESMVWADPLLRVAVLWVGMIGAMVATRSDHQITIDVVSRFLPQSWRAGVRVVTDTFTAVVSAVLAWAAFRLMLEDKAVGGLTIAFVPVWVCEAVLPVAFAIIALRYLLFALQHFKEARTRGALP